MKENSSCVAFSPCVLGGVLYASCPGRLQLPEKLSFIVCMLAVENCGRGGPALNIRLHANATTIRKPETYNRLSGKSIRAVAMSSGCRCRWNATDAKVKRSSVAGTRGKTILATLRPAQKAIVIKLRRKLQLPCDGRLTGGA